MKEKISHGGLMLLAKAFSSFLKELHTFSNFSRAQIEAKHGNLAQTK